MTMPEPATQFIRMYHPGLKQEAEFPRGSESQHYVAGWVLITESSAPEPAAEPSAMDRADVEADKVAAAIGGEQDEAPAKTKAGSRRASPSNDAGSGTDKE